jgi:hypothetical protein
MRTYLFVLALAAFSATDVSAQEYASVLQQPDPALRQGPIPLPGSSSDIAEQTLVKGARGLFRKTGLRVQIDPNIQPSARSRPVSGVMTAPEALRALLSGSAIVARFTTLENVFVSADANANAAYATRTVGRRGSTESRIRGGAKFERDQD